MKHPVKLFGKVKGESGDFSLYEEDLLNITNELCELLNSSISGYEECYLMMTFIPENLHVCFDFHGQLSEKELVHNKIKKIFSTHKSLEVIESYMHDNECYFEIRLSS